MTKGPEAFRTISEAADELGVPQHVLRFWETRFSFIRPMKRAGGRRFYRPQDLTVLRGVRALLHDEGYTIKGVQKLHREQGMSRVLAAAAGGGAEAGANDLSGAAPDAFGQAGYMLLEDEKQRLETALDAMLRAKADLDRVLAAR